MGKKIDPIKIEFSEPPMGFVGIYHRRKLPLTLDSLVIKINEIIDVINSDKGR